VSDFFTSVVFIVSNVGLNFWYIWIY